MTLSFSRSRGATKRIWRALEKSWRQINRDYLYRLIDEFKHDRLVDYRERDDGVIEVVLSRAGKEQALAFNIDKMTIAKPAGWDKKWRLVCFDIPETKREARRALRDKLLNLGFRELQKSVLIFPYPCEDEVDFILEFFEIRHYVHYAEVTRLSNDSALRLHFGLY